MHSNQIQAFFNYIKSLVGIVILDLPYAANNCGYLLAILMLFVIAYMTIRTSLMLIKVAEKTGLDTYSSITQASLGVWNQSIQDIFLVGQQLFVCIAYIMFFSRFSQLTLVQFGFQANPLISLLISLIVVFPLSLVNDMHFFHSTSTIGFLMAVFTLCMICFHSIPLIHSVEMMKPQGCFKFIGVGILAYEGIQTALPVRKSMHDKSEFYEVFMFASITCLIMYIGFIVINVQAFGDNLNAIILLNLPQGTLTYILQLSYAFSILLTYPVQIHPAFKVIEERLNSEQNSTKRFLIKLIITTTLYMVAYFIPNFSSFLNIVGIVFGIASQFIYPISIYYNNFELHFNEKIEIGTILTLSISGGVIGLYYSIIEL